MKKGTLIIHMEVKKLPVGESPVHCHLHHAFALNIILSNEQYTPWFLSEYVQTFIYGDTGFSFFTEGLIYDEPAPVEVQKIEKDAINNIDIVEFIINAIDTDNYFLTFMNEKYLAYRDNSNDYIHNVFIYGYDRGTQTFDMMGFQRGLYRKVTASFSEIRAAYANCADVPYSYDRYIYLVKVKTDMRFEFDMYRVYNRLIEYVYSQNSRNRDMLISIKYPDDTTIWGMDCYKKLREYFEKINNTGEYGDIIIPHLWWEHKKVMLMRIEYMNQNRYINDTILSDSYKPVERKALAIRNSLLKYNMTGNKRGFASMLTNLSYIEEQEKIILPKLLKAIRKNLYSEWILNAVVNKGNRIPLLKNERYITMIFDYGDTDKLPPVSDIGVNIPSGYIVGSDCYRDNTEEYQNALLEGNNRNCVILESENAENIYSMPFKADYLRVYHNKNNDSIESNISLIDADDINTIREELRQESTIPASNPRFTVLYINNKSIKAGDIESLLSEFPCYSVEAPDDFFYLYRNACGYELNKDGHSDNSVNIRSTAYSQQSGNCICGDSAQGEYITLSNNSWIRFKNIKWIINTFDYIVFYVSNVISSGEIQVVLKYLDGEIICKCKAEQSGENGFRAYKCDLNGMSTAVECDSYIDVYIKAVGEDEFQFDLYSYRFYAPIHTNSYLLNHTCYQKSDNVDVASVNTDGLYSYAISLRNSSWLLYEGLSFRKCFCEMELVIENGCDGDTLDVVLYNDTDSICSSIMIQSESTVSYFLQYYGLNGKYDMYIKYKSNHEDNTARLCSVKCGADIFEKIYAVEYSSCNDIQNGVFENDIYVVGYTKSNSYMCYSNVQFYRDITSFNILASNGNENVNGLLEIRVDGVDGILIGECLIPPTGDWNSFEQFSCDVKNVQGRHDLYFTFKGREDKFLVNLLHFWFL